MCLQSHLEVKLLNNVGNEVMDFLRSISANKSTDLGHSTLGPLTFYNVLIIAIM